MDPTLRTSMVALLAVALVSCGGGDSSGGSGGSGGGGSGSNSLSITFDTSSVEFVAAAPFDSIARNKTVTGSVAVNGTPSGTLYILVELPPSAFFTVPEVQIDTANSGHAVVTVPEPQTMGSGVFNSSFRIRACLNSATCASGEIRGSPFTVNVRYSVGDVVDADTVTPRVVPSGKTGSVILRGHGFTAGSSVSFGATPATSVSFVSPTELRANYPALAAGSYGVTLNAGTTAFNATLASVDTPAYAKAWIPHLQPAPFFPSTVLYDAERRAIIYAAGANNVIQILRYEYSAGSWVQSGRLDGNSAKQIRFSHDGKRLLALHTEQYGTNTLLDLDPVTLAILRTTPLDSNAYTFTLSNDGNYVFATRFPGSGRMSPVMLGSTDRTPIEVKRALIDGPAVIASGDGSRTVVYGQYGDAAVYDSSAQTWVIRESTQLRGSWDHSTGGSANMNGTRFADANLVFDQNLQPIGFAANLYLSASLLNADGSRLYAYDQGVTGSPAGSVKYLRTYDVNAPTTPGGLYPELAQSVAPIVLDQNPNGLYTTDANMAMALTPDERTVIICGLAGCLVQPAPP